MKILILGADGYLGAPTCKYFLERGHDVFAVDSYLKRHLLKIYQYKPLHETPYLKEHGVNHAVFDLSWDNALLEETIKKFQPECVIHYAEIPSAPYSMKGPGEGMRTIDNNVKSTWNLIHAIREYSPHTHIIKLGTMGEYGTPNIDIEEGWINIEHNGREDRLLYPKTPGSIYHLSKVYDSDLLAFAARVWGMAITDLNQGFVYGYNPIARFCYDEMFGTALNRFIVQAVVGHPLTIYGEGGQTRGVLNIKDTLACVELAALNPAKTGEFRVFNQFTEIFNITDLAYRVREAAKELGLHTIISHVTNPRVEKEQHYYNAKNTSLISLGLTPHYLTQEVLVDMLRNVSEHKDNIVTTQILPKTTWR